MKYLSLLVISLLFLSCGPSVLENSDIENHVLSKTSVLNQVKLGDSWDDTKLLAGEYWTVSENEVYHTAQFRKDIDVANEMIIIDFILSDNKVGGIGIYILSKNISSVALLLYANDIESLYKTNFGVDFSRENNDNITVNGRDYYYSLTTEVDSDYPSITVLCFDSTPM